MTYKLIATDLDETLLNSSRHVSEKTRDAIEKARHQGVKLVLATGRPYFSTTGTQQEVGVYRKPGEYTLTLNGAVVIDNETEQPLFVQGLPYETIHALFEAGLSYGVGMHIYTDNAVYAYGVDDDERAYVQGRMVLQELKKPDISFLKDSQLVKILFVHTDESFLRSIAQNLEEMSKDLEVSYSSNRYLEFNQKGIHKGYGLLRLGEILGIEPEEMIGIGDNFNDLAMIEAAGLGVGVANANPGIWDKCDIITENDCDHDPIAEIIEKYVLSKGEVRSPVRSCDKNA